MNHLTIVNFPEQNYAGMEAMNTLCTNISYCGQEIRTVMFTSRSEGEGKSSIVMNMMRTLAGYGKHVLLLDADLRRSTLARRYRFDFGQNDVCGLAQYLAGMCTLDDAVYQTNIEGAYVMPAGRDVLNSMQLLASGPFGDMMAVLRNSFDMVLVDTPPAGVIVDAIEIAKYCDGAVIVVAYNKGRGQDIATVVQNVQKTGCKVLGAVMNDVNLKSFRNRKYYYRSDRYSAYYHEYKHKSK
jgi:protein-tyrosine kinase